MSNRTRFEKEAKGNLEMVYIVTSDSVICIMGYQWAPCIKTHSQCGDIYEVNLQ